MTKLKFLGGAVFLLTTMVLGTATAYDVADISGAYGIISDGNLIVTDATSGESQVLPTTSVGRIVANGAGQATFVGTLNVSGVAIVDLASTAENSAIYSVNAETGLGVITAPVVATGVPEFPLGPEALPPGFDLTGAAEYALNFVIIDSYNLKVIGTKLSNIDTSTGAKTPIGALVISGSATKQIPDSTP